MAHWQNAQQVSHLNSPKYLRTLKDERQALDRYLLAATKNFTSEYEGRGLGTLPTELLLMIASGLVGRRGNVRTQFGRKAHVPLNTKRLCMVCRFRTLCRTTAGIGQTMIVKTIAEDIGSNGSISLDLPSKQPLAEVESVFTNSAFASLILVMTVYAQPYICLLYTSPSPRDGLLSRMPSSA